MKNPAPKPVSYNKSLVFVSKFRFSQDYLLQKKKQLQPILWRLHSFPFYQSVKSCRYHIGFLGKDGSYSVVIYEDVIFSLPTTNYREKLICLLLSLTWAVIYCLIHVIKHHSKIFEQVLQLCYNHGSLNTLIVAAVTNTAY